MKMKGVEVFKKIVNKTGYGIIEGLNPCSKYRIRMRVLSEGEEGKHSEIVEATTLENPTFDLKNSQSARVVN